MDQIETLRDWTDAVGRKDGDNGVEAVRKRLSALGAEWSSQRYYQVLVTGKVPPRKARHFRRISSDLGLPWNDDEWVDYDPLTDVRGKPKRDPDTNGVAA